MANILARIIVGVDRSDASKEAIDLAIRLARAHGSELSFCHVVDHAIVVGAASRALRDALIEEGNEIVRQAAIAAAARGVVAKAATLEGNPEYVLATCASDSGADAIVVGTCGQAGRKVFLGTTTEGVLRMSKVPVFIARGSSVSTPVSFERILVAIDNSDPSDAAIEFATALAASHGSRLTFCHVIDEDTLFEDAAGFGGDTYPVLQEWLTEAGVLTKAAVAGTHGDSIPSIDTSILTGIPSNEILNLATTEHADLIVMGSHGRRGVRHMLVGSVAQAVARRSPVPVVILRTAAGRESTTSSDGMMGDRLASATH